MSIHRVQVGLGKGILRGMSFSYLYRRWFPKDWTPVGPPILSPDGKMVAIPMLNTCIAGRVRGRFVTLEIRKNRHEFMHAMQSGVSSAEKWSISWRDNNTVVVSGSESGEWAFGLDGLYYPHCQPPYPGWTGAAISN